MARNSKKLGRNLAKGNGDGEKVVPVTNGAEAFVELINNLGVDYVFLNPGTDTFPIQKAISKFKVSGKHDPEIVLCLHESMALDAAHGYYMVSGKPQVVLVHVDVGLQQLGGALHSAQRGRIPVIICSGMAASTFGEKRGGRSHRINWLQDQLDQTGIVRNYVKWYFELQSNKNIHDVLQRAYQVALTEPCGPVYIAVSPEVLWEKIDSVRIPPVAKHRSSTTPQVDTNVLEKVADMLLEAEKPLILGSYSGRHPESVESLIKLAEMTGARVLTAQTRLNFPSSHPLCTGIDPIAGRAEIAPYLEEADVVFIIDHEVPYVPAKERPNKDTRIVHFDIDPVKTTIPLWTFPADIAVKCDSSKAIPLLNDMLSRKMTSEKRYRVESHSTKLKNEHMVLRKGWITVATSKAKQKPMIDPSRVLPLLKGNVLLPIILPKIEAVLSPKAKIAIAALLAGAGMNDNVSNMPRAKNIGAVANSPSSACVAAERVILDNRGRLFLPSLTSSETP